MGDTGEKNGFKTGDLEYDTKERTISTRFAKARAHKRERRGFHRPPHTCQFLIPLYLVFLLTVYTNLFLVCISLWSCQRALRFIHQKVHLHTWKPSVTRALKVEWNSYFLSITYRVSPGLSFIQSFWRPSQYLKEVWA